LFYERRLGSLAAVAREAKTMDEDAGISIPGRYEGMRCYAFVTRFGALYTVMVYERKGARGERVGKRLAWEEVDSVEDLRAFLRKVAPNTVRAFAY
jgi:hypothetical protein